MAQARPRILVVDDDELIREALATTLGRLFECGTAQSAEHAAKTLQQEKFDLVVLDINMPGKSGMEFLPEIIARYPDLPVVMLTGLDDTATAVKAMREGAYDYATKPITFGEMAGRIENALARRELLLENRANLLKLEQMGHELELYRYREARSRTRPTGGDQSRFWWKFWGR